MSSTTPPIRIRLFGPVQIEHDGVPVQKLGSQKSLVLLAYLMRNPHEHSRSKLAGLLWMDQPAAKARSNLRWALNNLSNLLPDCFTATRQTLRYHPSAQSTANVPWVDIQEFVAHTERLAAAQSAHTTSPVEEPSVAANQAIDLYRGEFLEGIELDDAPELELWLLHEREYWRREVITLLEQLLTQARAAGHYPQAEAYANRLLTIEAWHEETHRQLMWLLAATGQRSAALAQFEICRTILAEELGVEPAVETVELYTQIRDGQITPAQERLMPTTDRPPLLNRPTADSPAQHTPPPRPPMYDWGEAPLVEEFYGREAESQQLERWLVAEQARLVLLIGMGGMGKTTFAAHRTRQLADHFSHVIWRTLVNVPTAETILHTWVQSLAGQHPLAWPEQFDEQLHLLLHYLREKRCLLILDNFESVLQEQTQAGHYRTGYEPYGQLLRAIGNSDHQSTLLITSREEPYALTRLMDAAGRVQRLELRGLDLNAGRALLAERGLADSVAIEIALVMRASGSPLALKIIAETIRDL
ncbi:MAG: AAA family ATPase, partial [Caldilineaceae bacterium]|nr:AAA family ATPase [Caldilineaceae bacterium]